MGILSKTKTETPFYAEQLSSIKEYFKVAHENASNLHSQMEEDIKSKEAQIAQLQADIDNIKSIKADTEAFINNISKLS